MNANKILYNTAMEFYDLAGIAKAKDDIAAHRIFLQKAYSLVSEVVHEIQKNNVTTRW